MNLILRTILEPLVMSWISSEAPNKKLINQLSILSWHRCTLSVGPYGFENMQT
jgi:hypothetical protein